MLVALVLEWKANHPMTKTEFNKRLKQLGRHHALLLRRKNHPLKSGNGIFDRYEHPVLAAEHTPLSWRYDFDHASNPHLMTRLGVNAAFNVGAMEFDKKIILMARVEGWDRKSFFAVAESRNGVDDFRFWDYPVRMPELEDKETNLYDMRLVRHEDGWIYGLFCAERHDDSKPDDLSAAIARCGIARTKDLVKWERLTDLKTPALHQRNCVLHPEFVNGKYAFYTRPMSDFAATGSGDGIGWGLVDDIANAVVEKESIIDPRFYHTIKEGKNGLGPAPIKTDKGWLHLAHGVRNTAAGMRYVLYVFLCDLKDPSKQISRAGRSLHGAGRRRTRGRRFQCGVRQRLGGPQKWRRVYLLRLVRYTDACRHNDCGEAAGLCHATHRPMRDGPNCAWTSGANSSPKICAGWPGFDLPAL